MKTDNIPMRIILDRSVFHGDKIDLFMSSKLLDKVGSGEAEIYYTPMFIEETLRMSIKSPDVFTKQWDYLAKLNSKRWFLHIMEIVEQEINSTVSRDHYYLRSDTDINNSLKNIIELPSRTLPKSDIQTAIDITLEQRKRNEDFRTTRIILREGTKWNYSDFPNFYKENVDKLLREAVFKSETEGRINRWKENIQTYPFTTNLTRTMLAVIFIPFCNHNIKYDANDKSDAEQLSYLTFADVMVSDDKRFMKLCFELLHENSNKHFMSSIEFLDYINK